KLLAAYSGPEAFRKQFTVDATLISKLVTYAGKEGIEGDADGLARSKELISLRLKALIARDLWDTSAYWEVINADNPVDRSFQKALEALTDGSFQRFGMVK
ncbi:MAG: hypothetical protein KA186_12495, partial [Flavobacteriales bacterium]|nr:hypothetical protein [Flavobacteriales bacterium]